jgi:dipicolinate synthase subunit B
VPLLPLKGITIGFALPASHFIINTIFKEISKLVKAGAGVYPLLLVEEENSAMLLEDTVKKLKALTGHEPCPFGEERGEDEGESTAFDLLIIAPCPQNVVKRLLGAWASPGALNRLILHLHSNQPIILALVANGGSEHLFSGISQLMRLKSVFFVPFGPMRTDENKTILVTRMDLIYETCLKALEGPQLQPVFWENHWLPQ